MSAQALPEIYLTADAPGRTPAPVGAPAPALAPVHRPEPEPDERPDPLRRLTEVARSAVDPLEIAAEIEFEGFSDHAIRERYGLADVFALAESLWRQEPRQPVQVAAPPSPWRPNPLRSLLHGLLYGLPAVLFPAGIGLLAGRGTVVVLIASLLTSWSLSQGVASLGYARAGRLDPGGSLRVMRLGMVVALAGVAAALLICAQAVPVRVPALLFGAGQGMYMIGASVLMAANSEILLLAALAPGVLGGAVFLLLGRPHPLEHWAWAALAATPLLAVLLAVARTLRAKPALGRLLVPAELRDTVPAMAFGLCAAALLIFPVAAGVDGHGRANIGALLATVPLSLSMGAAEWCLFAYRRRTQRLLRDSRAPRHFAVHARLALLIAVLQYLLTAALCIAAAVAIVSGTGLLHPRLAYLPAVLTYLVLGVAMFLALLLQTFGVRLVVLLACAAALTVEFALRPLGVAGQLAADAGLMAFLAVYSGLVLGRVVRHAY